MRKSKPRKKSKSPEQTTLTREELRAGLLHVLQLALLFERAENPEEDPATLRALSRVISIARAHGDQVTQQYRENLVGAVLPRVIEIAKGRQAGTLGRGDACREFESMTLLSLSSAEIDQILRKMTPKGIRAAGGPAAAAHWALMTLIGRSERYTARLAKVDRQFPTAFGGSLSPLLPCNLPVYRYMLDLLEYPATEAERDAEAYRFRGDKTVDLLQRSGGYPFSALFQPQNPRPRPPRPRGPRKGSKAARERAARSHASRKAKKRASMGAKRDGD